MTLLNLNKISIRNILVLEDWENRINWLHENVPFNYNIHWHSEVKDFVSEYTQFQWDLIILDCDLTPEQKFDFDDSLGLYIPKENEDFPKYMDRDSDGYNGEDAVRLLIDLPGVNKTIPYLVWSANPDGANNMMNNLISNGFNAHRQKYDQYCLSNLKEKIHSLLGLN